MPSVKTESLVTMQPKWKIKCEDYNITSTEYWELLQHLQESEGEPWVFVLIRNTQSETSP